MGTDQEHERSADAGEAGVAQPRSGEKSRQISITYSPKVPAGDAAGTADQDVDVPSARIASIAVGVSVTVFVAAGVLFLKRGTPFSGDEPLYALRSRSFRLADAPWFAWPSYRAPGLALLSVPLVTLPEPLLRAMVVVFAAASVPLVYVLAKSFVGRNAACWAAVVFAATPGLLASSTYFFPDVPGMFLVLVAVVALVQYLLGKGSPAWLLLMCGSVAIAGLVRFSVGVVVLAALVALVIAAPGTVSAPRGRAFGAGVLLIGVTAIGTFVPSIGTSDGMSPWAANRELVSQNAAPFLRRFVTLADASSVAYGFSRNVSLGATAGAVFLVVCGAGVLLGLRSALRARDRLALFPVSWFLMTLGFYVIALDHFEIRYLTPMFAPVAMVAGAGLSSVARRLAPAAAALLAVVTLGSGMLCGTYLITMHLRADDAEDLAVRATGTFVAATDHECTMTFGSGGGKVWLLLWYSGCHASSDQKAEQYIAVWRNGSAQSTAPRRDAELVHSEAFTLAKQGGPEHLVIDLYRVRDTG